MNRVAAVIQSRMGSTRCPGKALRPLAGVPTTEHIIKRAQQVADFDRIVLAIPDSSSEHPLVELAHRMGIDLFQGPEEDVLLRFILAGDAVNADHVLRICGDNPLIDIPLARDLVHHHLRKNADYTIPEGVIPVGTATEIVKVETLKHIASITTDPAHREHVITYFRDHPESFQIERIPVPPYLEGKNFRLTLDTEQDFLLMEKIYERFYDPHRLIVDLEQILSYLETHPEWTRLNADVPQKNWRLGK